MCSGAWLFGPMLDLHAWWACCWKSDRPWDVTKWQDRCRYLHLHWNHHYRCPPLSPFSASMIEKGGSVIDLILRLVHVLSLYSQRKWLAHLFVSFTFNDVLDLYGQLSNHTSDRRAWRRNSHHFADRVHWDLCDSSIWIKDRCDASIQTLGYHCNDVSFQCINREKVWAASAESPSFPKFPNVLSFAPKLGSESFIFQLFWPDLRDG